MHPLRTLPTAIVVVALLLGAATTQVPAVAAAPQTDGSRLRLVLRAPGPEAVSTLSRLDIDVWSVESDRVTVLVDDKEKSALLAAGFEILDEQLLPVRAPTLAETDGFYTFDEYVAEMQQWAVDHPDIVSLSSIGKTWEGRDIWLLKVSDNVALEEDEPTVLLLSMQHAREWLAGMTLRGIAEHLIDQYGVDPDATDLVNSMQLDFILVANPDGYVYTHTTDRYWRKNRRDNGDGTYGVDLNRNFPDHWAASSATGSITYGGPSPLSEPEDQAVVNWIESRPRPLAGCLNYHTYGTRVMHNWAYTYTLPPNTDLMGPLARQVAFAIESVNGQRMRNGSWSITLDYTGTGSTIDYFQAQLGIPTLTLELRPGDGVPGGFAPPGTMIAPSVSENIVGCETFLRWARTWADDTTTPSLSNIQISQLSDTRATISWDTDDPADRAVEYGLSAAYGTTMQPDRFRGLHQSIVITGLNANTLYHARARSENLAGLVGLSDDVTFRTTATPQDLTPPAPPVLEVVRGAPGNRIEFRWNPSSSGDVVGYRIYEDPHGAVPVRVADETTLGAAARSAFLDNTSGNGKTRSFYVTAVDDAAVPNESVPSDEYAVLTDTSTSTSLLIVDGYDRWNSRHESQGRNHAFAADHGIAVGAWHVPFDTCANESLGGLVTPDDYSTFVWVLGDESTADETFSASEQGIVASFLERGGNLFVSGSDIAYDLDRPSGPTAADRTFFHTYLCAAYAKDNTSAYDVYGTGPGSLFGAGVVRFDDGSRGIYRVWTPDAVTPNNGATVLLRTANNDVCAIDRAGLFGNGSRMGRLVYLCFPFETIFPAASRQELMGRVLGYFGLAQPQGRQGLVAH